MQQDRRFPRWVFSVGTEPDPRFSLANERTFLAWIGVGLALVAGGVALRSVRLPGAPGLLLAAAIVLLLLGLLTPLLAWRQWGVVERALRSADRLPGSRTGLVLAIGLTLVAVLVLLAVVLA